MRAQFLEYTKTKGPKRYEHQCKIHLTIQWHKTLTDSSTIVQTSGKRKKYPDKNK